MTKLENKLIRVRRRRRKQSAIDLTNMKLIHKLNVQWLNSNVSIHFGVFISDT